MPKVNTLFNYFTSPKGASPRSNASDSPSSKPKPPSRSKSETPKREVKNKDVSKLKGKENLGQNREKKRLLEDDESNHMDDEDEVITPKPNKKKRRVIPEDNSDDSGDDYKPGAEESIESDGSVSEGVSEDEPGTESEEDESPKKKAKLSNGTKSKGRKSGKKSITKTQSTTNQEPPAKKASVTQSWPHLKYDFLQPDKIRDSKKRRPDHPEYDPKTVFVPEEFLNTLTPGVRQWWVLKSQHYDTVLFFKVGKFYELYHMDAVIGVNELNLTFMRGEFAHSGFPERAYGRFAGSLIERGYKVARIEQTETPDMMAQRCAKQGKVTKFDKVVKREICQISTKGTRVYTVQDTEASNPTSTYLLAIAEQKMTGHTVSTFGVCFIDTSIGIFHLGQFQDDRFNSKLLTMLAHYPPAHIIYERGNLTQSTLKILNDFLPGAMKEALLKETQFWSSSKVLRCLHDADYFNPGNSEFSWPTGLQAYLNKADSLGLTAEEDKELAVNALGGCVYLLKEYQLDCQLLAQRQFKTYAPPDFSNASELNKTNFAHNMILDAMSINNLRVFGTDGSLFQTLDYCCTPFGKRLLREWICRPSCRKLVIKERQDAVTELLDRPEVIKVVRGKLAKLPDLERLLSKIHAQGNAAKVRDHPDSRAILFDGHIYSKRIIAEFSTVLNGFEEALKIVESFEDFNNLLINKCTKYEPEGDFPELRKTLDYFKTAFDHEEAKKEGFIVPKRGVDQDYDAVLLELSDIEKELNEYLEKQRKHFGVQIKFFGKDKKKYQIEVPESQLKKVGSGYELQGSRKGFKRYYTDEAKELLARQIAAEEQKDKVLKDSNRKVFAKFSDHYDEWSNACYNLAILDCLISLSEYARTCDTCVPTIYDDTDENEIFVDIRDGKHPCITSENFIPNDTIIATEGKAPLMILTGPNMGGKSTLMRQVGLITIMAQIGSYVPASSCKLTLSDRIFTRLGANDDIMSGQSRGTSTYDGTAIAASVVEALTKMGCRTLFSTHYHSLVEDYKKNPNVTLAHMACMVENEDEEQVSEENVTFLYKLSEGACPKSYGFNAARLAGIPPNITKRAHEIATKLEAEVNLRHAFTALCTTEDSVSLQSMFKKGLGFLSKC
ncbi:hypothetical protein QAD02_010556 [Eretmocerus hayati]|uniref:Uncharacterized protein n=1 Tax=Eretmocerus hayati TaxID=131215 RepID=A0ACC2NU46_9HYME|nr:hypothetical protein QAD02_010556 [Eretmocerus hayati]